MRVFIFPTASVFVSSFVLALTLATPHLSYGSEQKQVENSYVQSPFKLLPPELREKIVTEVACELASNDKPLTDLAKVNTEWNQILEYAIEPERPIWWVLRGVSNEMDKEIYRRFINSKLIYRPIPGSDEGMLDTFIQFKIKFDLSQYGDSASRITLTTDPLIFFKVDNNERKVNILIAPYFLIKKHLNAMTNPFQGIMMNWDPLTAPIGIFWRWSPDEDLTWFDYQVTSSLLKLSSQPLHNNWYSASQHGQCDLLGWGSDSWADGGVKQLQLMFDFENN